MLNKEQAHVVVKKLCANTRFYATVLITDNDQGVTRFANSEINQNISIANTTVSLTLYEGKKEATCTTNVLTDEGLKKLATDAESILPFIPDGEFEHFPSSNETVEDMSNDTQLAGAFNVTERAAIIKRGVETVPAGYTAAGALTLDCNAYAYGDSSGCFRFAAFDNVQFNTVVTHEDGAAGSGEAVSFNLDTLDIETAFAKAKRTAEMARNPVSVDLGAYTVVLSPVALGDLMSFMAYLLNAKTVDYGISFAINKMNERVFGDNITLRDDVHAPGVMPLFFDFEGNKRKALTLIENGVVRNLLYDNKTAARHNQTTTGHALSNKGYGGHGLHLTMDGGTQSLDDIIAGTEKGIYINEFHYTNFVNPRTLQITGLTRNGAFLIENGKLGSAVSTLRFTQNFIESLNAVTAISKERVRINAGGAVYLMPAARIDGFHFTSKQ